MKNYVREEAKKILIDYMKNNVHNSKNKYCKGDNWRFAINHSLRVEKCAEEIMGQFKELSEEDILTIHAAAIFHDIGNIVQRENHGQIGAEIVENIFSETEHISKSLINKDRLIKIISGHSDKNDEKDSDIASIILKDADVLDQIGAMSIFMHSSKYNYSDYDYYKNIVRDIETKEFSFCDKQYRLLRTNAAQKIMKKKIEFIKELKKQLEYEIQGEYCEGI